MLMAENGRQLQGVSFQVTPPMPAKDVHKIPTYLRTISNYDNDSIRYPVDASRSF